MRDEFLRNIYTSSKDYTSVIKNLNECNLKVGASWLLSKVENPRKNI